LALLEARNEFLAVLRLEGGIGHDVYSIKL